MNADEILARTLAEHDSPTPDPDAVLAAVHARVAHRRRTGPLVAAAAAAAIAIGASVLVGVARQSPSPTGATPTPPVSSGSPRVLSPSPSPPTDTYVPPQIPAEPTPTPADTPGLESPEAAARATVDIDTTWFPPGTVKQTDLSIGYGRQTRDYEVDGPEPLMDVQLALWTGSSLTPDQTFDAQPRDLALAGRPAREWSSPGLYGIVLQVPGGRVAQVKIFETGGNGRGDMQAIGRRVATSLRLDRASPINPAFRPTYVPQGLIVRGIGISVLDGTGWSLSKPKADMNAPSIGVGTEKRKATSSTVGGSPVPGTPVRGHPTHVFTDRDQVSLWVDGLVGGQSLVVIDFGKKTPLAELYKIAAGVR